MSYSKPYLKKITFYSSKAFAGLKRRGIFAPPFRREGFISKNNQ